MIERELVAAGLVDSLLTMEMVEQEADQALLSHQMPLFQKETLVLLMNTMKMLFPSHTQ